MAKSRRSAPINKRTASPRKRASLPGRPAAKRSAGAPVAGTKASPGGALELYEAGLRALQAHDYRKSHDAFSLVVSNFPGELDIAERAGLYVKLCAHHLNDNSGPATFSAQQRLADATFALNAGRFDHAIEQARSVLDRDKDNDHAHYVLALAHALKGDSATSIDHLSRAIDINQDCRASALGESDFETLRSNPAFRALIDPASDSSRRKTRSK